MIDLIMEEFGGEAILQNSTDSKTCFGSETEFINSQLIRREDNGDDHDHGHAYHDHVHHQEHVMGLFSSSGGGSSSGLMIPATVNFTDQMSLFQADHHVHSLGFDGSKKDKSTMPQFFNFASPSASDTGLAIGDHNINYKTNLNLGGKKRKRSNAKNAGEKPKEVVHVRAKRGQATDSHSLAERVRREKINERLRCLQDLVPGCYKTMGMAVMLDVIINYVRSLQNQIEFLSMKLSAASMYNEMNIFEMAVDNMQSADNQGTEAYESWTKWRE